MKPLGAHAVRRLALVLPLALVLFVAVPSTSALALVGRTARAALTVATAHHLLPRATVRATSDAGSPEKLTPAGSTPASSRSPDAMASSPAASNCG